MTLMSLWHIIVSELRYRSLSSSLGILAFAVAMGTLMGTLSMLRAHEQEQGQILDDKEADLKARMESVQRDVRAAMAKLGFTLTIIPRGQDLGDWYSTDYAARTMPEEYVDRLLQPDVRTIASPVPQLRRRLKWPETGWTVIVIGRGNVPSFVAPGIARHIVTPGPGGSVLLGHEIHRGLGLERGESVELLGRRFRVESCLDEKGNKDDITVWMTLRDAQSLFGEAGKVNEILAVERPAAWADPGAVREELSRVLPRTQVVEEKSMAVARSRANRDIIQEARAALAQERDSARRLARARMKVALLVDALMLTLCGVWLGSLALNNVRARRHEIGIWRSFGVRSMQLASLFAAKWGVLGVVGAALGFAAATGAGLAMERWAGTEAVPDLSLLFMSLPAAAALAVCSTWLPVLSAARRDPAEILGGAA